jgi:hypothetical protein
VQHYFCGLLDFFQKIWAPCPYYCVVIVELPDMHAGERLMAKEQRRSNREVKKPKKPASEKKAALPPRPAVVERTPAKGWKRP